MNGIFLTLVTLSLISLCVSSPNSVLPCISAASEKAVTLTLTAVGIYAFWTGIIEIMKQSKMTDVIAKPLKPIMRKLFGKTSGEAENYILLNTTANLLGMGSIATPLGINAMAELDKSNDEYGQTMLFVLASTSLQIIPMTVLSLRASLKSANPGVIFLPTLLSTAVSSIIGILLVKIFVKK